MMVGRTIEGETHFSATGRKFVTVRRDNLQQVKDHLFGLIDMTTAGKLLGLQKRRMRQLLTLILDARPVDYLETQEGFLIVMQILNSIRFGGVV